MSGLTLLRDLGRGSNLPRPSRTKVGSAACPGRSLLGPGLHGRYGWQAGLASDPTLTCILGSGLCSLEPQFSHLQIGLLRPMTPGIGGERHDHSEALHTSGGLSLSWVTQGFACL